MMQDDLAQAKNVLEIEAQCILAAKLRLDHRFTDAVDLIAGQVKSGGKVIVIGVGKSGKIAAKVAATLMSTGTPALFLHPTEGLHGDLGVVGAKDVILAFSYSGNSEEILRLMPRIKSLNIKLISIVGKMQSELASLSDIALDGSVAKEACPLNLAPTSSTTVALALGDALAMVLSSRFEFKEENFANNHPGGALGRRLTLHVRDLMKQGAELGWVADGALMTEVVETATLTKLGAVLVSHGKARDQIVGLITDGDIRRALKHKEKFFHFEAKDIMTKSPVTISPDDKAVHALELMQNRNSQINVLPVVDGGGRCVGLVRLHDLIGQL